MIWWFVWFDLEYESDLNDSLKINDVLPRVG